MYKTESKYSKIFKKNSPNALNTLLNQLKTSNKLRKNYQIVAEGHQCPGSFKEIGKTFQKSENLAVIFK